MRRMLTCSMSARFIKRMRLIPAAVVLLISANGFARTVEEPRIVEKKARPLPVALSNDFEFRKTKLYFLNEKAPEQTHRARQTTSTFKPGSSGNAPNQKTLTLQDVPITFERQYRLFGAVTVLDQRQRFGDYFDFFWRAKRPADVTVRAPNIARRNYTTTFRRRRFPTETRAVP